VNVFDAKQFSLPVGEAAGWDATIVDHHRAVLNAIAGKVTKTRLEGSRPNGKKHQRNAMPRL
jgi:hypothetical protein